MKNLPSSKRQQGFTIVEIVIVLLVIGILAATFLPDLFKQKDDAKFSSAVTQIEKNFMSAVGRQVARTNTCTAANLSKANLVTRGLPENNVFGLAWTVTGVAANVVTVNYPVDSNDATAAADIATKLTGNPNITTAVASGTGSVNIGIRCN